MGRLPLLASLLLPATSLSPLPLPGVPLLGASLLIGPDPLFQWTRSLTEASMTSVIGTPAGGFGALDGIARFYPPALPGSTRVVLDVPASAIGLDIYSQGGVLHLADQTAYHTNRVRTSLLP